MNRTEKKRFPWYFIDMLIYILLVSFIFVWIKPSLSHVTSVSFLQLLIFALATYRGANLIANDVITKPIRKPFIKEEKKNGKISEAPLENRGLRGSLGELLYCPSCTGIWVATFFVFLWLLFPTFAWVITSIFALSACERMLTAFVGVLEKNAE